MGFVIVAFGKVRVFAGGEADKQFRGFFLAQGKIQLPAVLLQVDQGNMLFRSQLPYRARIFPVGIEQGTAAHKETAGNGRQQDWLSAFFQGGLTIAPQVFRIG